MSERIRKRDDMTPLTDDDDADRDNNSARVYR